MLNTKLLNERYKKFIPSQALELTKFIETTNSLKAKIDFNTVNTLKPLLILNRNQRNELCYLLSVNYSLQRDKILNPTIISGQTFTRQHFADNERDKELYDNTYYNDLAYITLSPSDFTSEYMENLIIDLIDFRYTQGKLTVILYDLQNQGKQGAKKLSDHFNNNHYIIQDLSGVATKHSAISNSFAKTTAPATNTTASTAAKAKKKGRIL